MDGSTAWRCRPKMSCGPGAVAASSAWSLTLFLCGGHKRCVVCGQLISAFRFKKMSRRQIENLKRKLKY